MSTATDPPALPQQQLQKSTTSTFSAVGKTRFEWTIRDFQATIASLGDDMYLSSAIFTVSAASANISINNNKNNSSINHNNSSSSSNSNNSHSAKFRLYCLKEKDTKEHLGFFVELLDQQKEVMIDFSLAFLKADMVTQWGRVGPATKKYNDNTPSWGWSKMTLLKKLKEELLQLPEGNFTIICELTVRFGSMDTVTHTPVEHIAPLIIPSISDSLSSNLASLFFSGDMSDVTILCGDKTFHCHKLILASCSDVFKAMFGDNNKNNNNNSNNSSNSSNNSHSNFKEGQEGKVTIKDVEPEIADTFFKAFYLDNACDSITNDQSLLQLLKAANMYNFQHLKLTCEEKILSNKGLNIENAANMLSWAIACNAKNLEGVARKYIGKNLSEVVKTKGFADLLRAFPNALSTEPKGAAAGWRRYFDRIRKFV